MTHYVLTTETRSYLRHDVPASDLSLEIVGDHFHIDRASVHNILASTGPEEINNDYNLLVASTRAVTYVRVSELIALSFPF